MKPMNEQELRTEWQYRYDERLAILGCYGTPTTDQHEMAKHEADEAIARLRLNQHNLLPE